MRTSRVRIVVSIYRKRTYAGTSSAKVKRPLLTNRPGRGSGAGGGLAGKSCTDGFCLFYETRSPSSQHGLVCIDPEKRNSSEIESRMIVHRFCMTNGNLYVYTVAYPEGGLIPFVSCICAPITWIKFCSDLLPEKKKKHYIFTSNQQYLSNFDRAIFSNRLRAKRLCYDLRKKSLTDILLY